MHFVLDVAHNSVSRASLGEKTGWLHRKGATPTDAGAVVIPGSRGSLSYIVDPVGDGLRDALIHAGVAAVIATLKPLLTYKTNRPSRVSVVGSSSMMWDEV